MQLRDVHAPRFRDPRDAVLYAIRLWLGRVDGVRVKMLHPRIYLVVAGGRSFVVVVRETRYGWHVRPVEETLGAHEERVM